jgi:hypothetical protein
VGNAGRFRLTDGKLLIVDGKLAAASPRARLAASEGRVVGVASWPRPAAHASLRQVNFYRHSNPVSGQALRN